MEIKKGANLDVLIIDDNKVDRAAIKRYLAEAGNKHSYKFYEADWGKEALDMMQTRSYDCVFLDYHLPDMDGVLILKKLYDHESGLTQSPVVVLTGQGSETVMLEALRWGAQDYLIKENITPATLSIALNKARELYELKSSRHQAEQELHHVRKMEAIGQLTSGVAHDFNNLLTVVIGNIHLLKRRFKAGFENFSAEDIGSKIDAIETVSAKGADLVRRLMVFTRQSPLAQEIVNVNESIVNITELLKRTLGEAIEIETILDREAWPVFIDGGEFENILINFAVNARDAMPRGGKLILETQNVILDDAYTLRHPDVQPGAYLMIAISDTGSGMPPEILKRIFEPFFTTKPAGEGTGLGMSMAYGFVRQCNGHIHVYSEEGHGTVFRIYLPKMSIDSEADIEAHETKLPEGQETILIAEDDEDVREIAASMLEKLGYKTLQAKSGRVALEILKREHKNIDLVFTDIIMPGGMSGIDLVRHMREYYPDVKVLYTSGYTQNSIPDYQLCAGEELISKPYRREVLAMKLRKILDKERATHV